MSDNKCERCGKYSGGATLCNACQKDSLKKTKKPTKPKKPKPPGGVFKLTHDDIVNIEVALRCRVEACDENEDYKAALRWRRTLRKFYQ